MRPKVPADLNTLGITALAALSDELRDAILAALGTDPTAATPEVLAEANEMRNERVEVRRVLAVKRGAAALATEMGDEPDEDITEGDQAPDQTITPPEGDPTPPPAPAPDADGDHATPPAPTVPTTTGGPAPTPSAPGRNTLAGLVASSGVPNMRAGEGFSSWTELANRLAEKGDTVTPNSSERFEVAQVRGSYDKAHTLETDFNWNMARFEPEGEITAALCAPGTPYYGMSCDNTLRRPVFASMGQFAAPRGKVSIPTSPTLSDITSQNAGYGQWTFAMDDDGVSAKNCAVVACNSFNDFFLYGVWKCLTVKNLMALTYPELVEAYLNRLGAAQARMAEILLLEAMATGTTTVAAPSLGYGTATSFTTLVMEYLALYQETQRWDITSGMEAWMPRWVLTALQVDLARRRTTNGDVQRIASVSQVETMLSDAGMNAHWFIDTPSWAPSIPSVHSGGVMNRLPSTIPVILAPRGKFAVIDRGNLSIGVTGNNIYRDNTSNRNNTYTFFVESFEGLVNTDSCPAHLLRIPVCHNGVQVDDRMVDCGGIDELGYQS